MAPAGVSVLVLIFFFYFFVLSLLKEEREKKRRLTGRETCRLSRDKVSFSALICSVRVWKYGRDVSFVSEDILFSSASPRPCHLHSALRRAYFFPSLSLRRCVLHFLFPPVLPCLSWLGLVFVISSWGEAVCIHRGSHRSLRGALLQMVISSLSSDVLQTTFTKSSSFFFSSHRPQHISFSF